MNSRLPIFKVSDLLGEMRQLMEKSYPEIWIEGELSSLSKPASGHLYFSLKDEQSQLRCAMFRNRATISHYRPKAGDLVRVRAKISVYTARGDLQCIVQHIEEAGEGALQKRFEELKAKLSAEGLFSVQNKREIPPFAKHIGLITSPSGAAIRDVLSTLQRRAPGIPVTIYPAVVQGDGAPASLIKAISDALQHNRCDVIILTRGGGSLEDLWCFNDEALARTIVNTPIPIVSGVGHEVDTTIADLVADHRAATPTAAAELLSPDHSHLITQINAIGFRLPRLMARNLQQRAQSVDLSYHQLLHPSEQLKRNRLAMEQVSQRLNNAAQMNRLRHSTQLQRFHQKLALLNPLSQLKQKQQNTQSLAARLLRAERSKGAQYATHLQGMAEQLQLVSPLATLSRGFSIARDTNNQIVRSAKQVSKRDQIRVQLSQGALDCTVDTVEK